MNGSIINLMVTADNHLIQALTMREIFIKGISMAMVFISGLTIMCMMECGRTIVLVAKGLLHGMMVSTTLEIGRMMRSMERE